MFSWWPFKRRQDSDNTSPSRDRRSLTAESGPMPFEARLSLYRTLDVPPEIHVIAAGDVHSFVNTLSQRIYDAAAARGGRIPFVAIREIVENLLHAQFRSVVVTVYPSGDEISISDQGPGIPDKAAARRPGFTTATTSMRRFIKGVGSGLSVAGEALRGTGGALEIENNLGGGTVVTLFGPTVAKPTHETKHKTRLDEDHGGGVTSIASSQAAEADEAISVTAAKGPPNRTNLAGNASAKGEYTLGSSRSKAPSSTRRREAKAEAPTQGREPLLTPRQQRVLALLADFPELGPSTAATEANISLSSAYRDLVVLEEMGFAEPVDGGKRRLSDKGRQYLATLAETR